MGRRGRTIALALALSLPAVPVSPADPAQYDPVEVARFINGPKEELQLAAIADELNLFLLAPIARSNTSAERAFALGAGTIGNKAVPVDVLTALRTAFRGHSAEVGLQAIYAFGVLAVQPEGAERQALLRASEPELVAFLGSQDPALRIAAIRVIGRVAAPRPGDAPIEAMVGDAVVNELNDADSAVRLAAMDALGAMREVRAVQGLTQLFEYHGGSREGEAALDAIARIAHPSSAATLTAALTSKSSTQRVIAIEGLARLRDASALPAMQAAAARDGSDRAALALAFANAILAGGPTDSIVAAQSRPKLRDQATQYLAELGRLNVR